MPTEYIITLTAADRVGILAAITKAFAELGGDLREVSVTVMRGYFTMILASQFPEGRTPDIIGDHIRDIGRPFGMEVSVRDPHSEELLPPEMADLDAWFLHVSGPNRPGIMREVAALLAARGVEVLDLYSLYTESDDRFTMTFELAVPESVVADELASEIERLSAESGWTTSLQPVDKAEASRVPKPLSVRRGRYPAVEPN